MSLRRVDQIDNPSYSESMMRVMSEQQHQNFHDRLSALLKEFESSPAVDGDPLSVLTGVMNGLQTRQGTLSVIALSGLIFPIKVYKESPPNFNLAIPSLPASDGESLNREWLSIDEAVEKIELGLSGVREALAKNNLILMVNSIAALTDGLIVVLAWMSMRTHFSHSDSTNVKAGFSLMLDFIRSSGIENGKKILSKEEINAYLGEEVYL